ncbi:MAG: radical SAM protein [Nitrospiria bacterium]
MSQFSALYIEEGCRDWPRVQNIIAQCPDIPRISCGRYGEVFNLKAQNFRLQKQYAGLILAKKHRHFVLPAPAGYGFGNEHSYYFSHMLNCPYDCRYCFLQGMYRSAHHVLFVNYADFEREIEGVISDLAGKPCYFYSGYDCDSLAFEQYSRFAAHFIPVFQRHPQAYLELRTKSTQVRPLMRHTPSQNIVVALSFSPENVARHLEHRAPALSKRIAAAKKVQERGWPLALRFEPLIDHEGYEAHYQRLFARLFRELDASALHSVSIGFFRMPQPFFKNIVKLYPDEPLFAGNFTTRRGLTSYAPDIEAEMLSVCEKALLEYIPGDIYYRCEMEHAS